VSEPPSSPAIQARVLIPFTIVTLIWGSTWLVIRDQIAVVPPSWSVSYRFLIAAAVMFGWALLQKIPLRLGREGMAIALLVGILQFVLNFNFVYRAEAYVTSGLVAVVFALLIVPNAVFARIFLKQDISRRFLAGSAVAMTGVALLFAHELEAASAGPRAVMLGIGITLLGVLSASTANVLQAVDRVRRLPIISLMAWAMLIGGIINAGIASALDGPPVIETRPAYIAGLLYLGVIGSAVTFSLYFGLIRVIGPARAAYTSVLIPVIAMALSTIFEGYRWSPLAAAGAALVIFGLVIALQARRS